MTEQPSAASPMNAAAIPMNRYGYGYRESDS
jgi:hypothetical protein